MSLLRILLATAIVSLGISGTVFVVKSHNLPTQKAENNSLAALSEENNNAIKQLPFVEQLTDQSISSPLINQNGFQTSDNLTDTFINNIAKSLVEKNPDGPSADVNNQKLINAPNPDEIINNLLAETLKNFDATNLNPVIKENDLNISEDNSKEALTQYFIAFRDIVTGSVKKLPGNLSSGIQNLSVEDIKQISSVYRDVIHQFYNIAVPRSALEIHKKEIAFFTAKNYIFEKIQNYQADPLATILAAQKLENLDNGFIVFNQEIIKFFKSVL